jgi:nucleoside-diphosphate-sugar epimerase
MRVTLTGSTGFIGSHILTELHEHGHEVTALVRDDAQADRVAAVGATPAVVDLYDRPAVTSMFSSADGAIHTASPGDATSANLDSAVVDAATEAFAGTGKPYLQISGEWIYGDNPDITEESPIKAPAMVAWKEESAGGRYIVGDGSNPTVSDLTEAAAVAVGAPGAVAGSDDEARARLGDYFAEVLLLDQRAGAAKARADLGWQPSRPTLADEFRHGSYRTNGG